MFFFIFFCFLYFLCFSFSFSQDKLCSYSSYLPPSILFFYFPIFLFTTPSVLFFARLTPLPVIFPFLLSFLSVCPFPMLSLFPSLFPLYKRFWTFLCSLMFLYPVSSASHTHILLLPFLIFCTFFPFPPFLPPIFLTLSFLVSLLLSRCRKTQVYMEITRSYRCEDRCRAGNLGQVHINIHYWAQVWGRDLRCMEGSLQVSLGFPPGQV